jgi:hypothetical protein
MSNMDMILVTSMLAETAPDHRGVDEESCWWVSWIQLELVMKPIDLVRKTINQPFRKGVPCLKGRASSYAHGMEDDDDTFIQGDILDYY